ncbi:copper resistance protein CopC [Micromonospora sp. NPDC049900]|uniref:copper resistance CopC family protein n=1 Tax=Micromonospora sp. NPDC049900 TaxID=3364275 RepID=UPI00378DB39C
MRRLPAAPRRAVSGLLALVLASAAVLLASTPPAAAHGTLAVSTPAEGATVDKALSTVELYFTEQVRDDAYFTVTAPGGARVDNGWTHGAPTPLDRPVREYFLVDGVFEPREYATGYPATVTLAHLPATGRYSVSYLSVASDGETVRGTMSFRYTGPVTDAPAGWQPPTDQPAPALLAAAQQHETSGSGATPATSPEAAPAPAMTAPPSSSGDGGDGAGRLAWLTGAVALGAALAALLVLRRRPTTGVPTGRSRPTRRPARPRGDTRRTGTGRRPDARAGAKKSASGGKSATGGAKASTVTASTVGTGRTSTVAATSPARVNATSATGGTSSADGPVGALATTERETPVVDPPDDAEPAPVGPANRRGDTRLVLLVGGLVVALLAGFGLGRLGTDEPRTTSTGGRQAATAGAPVAGAMAGDGHQHPPGTGPHTHPGDGTGQATGTQVSVGGYTMQPVLRTQQSGKAVDYRFRIVGPDGQPATRFAVVHDKPLHLIVVGNDLGGYQHLHPTMTPDGTWSVPLTLDRAGDHRVYADFSVTTTDGRQLPLVLGVDHQVPGAYTPAGLPPPQRETTAGPYTVVLEGTPTVGVTTPLALRVDRTGGTEPARLERYLGAYGHLVLIREGDLGLVHVHPEQELVDGAVTFWLTPPSPGRYRAFFDFQVDGEVHTAAYTVTVE